VGAHGNCCGDSIAPCALWLEGSESHVEQINKRYHTSLHGKYFSMGSAENPLNGLLLSPPHQRWCQVRGVLSGREKSCELVVFGQVFTETRATTIP